MIKSPTEHLENRIVRIDNSSHPRADEMPNTLLVVGVEREIGITMVDPCNPEKEVLCINGPCSPLKLKRPSNHEGSKYTTEDYNKLFDQLCEQMENGKIIPHQTALGFGGAVCAFKG